MAGSSNQPVVGRDFDDREYATRCAELRAHLRALDVDALLVTQPEHLVYLFGYLPTAATFQAGFLPTVGEPTMVVRALDEPVCRSDSWVSDLRIFRDWEDSVSLTAQVVRESGCARVGYEADSNILTVRRFQYLVNECSDAVFVDASGVLWEQRLRKSPAEVDLLAQAAQIADEAMAAAIAATGEGLSEREPAAAAYKQAMLLGADNGRVLLSASGRRSGHLHGRLGTSTLAAGDVLHLEMVPQVCGYSARVMRPVSIGAPSAELERIAIRLIEIQDEQLRAIRPGTAAAHVDSIARSLLLESGLVGEYPNTTGYTLGLHAQPRTTDFTRVFHEKADWTIESGMAFHMYVRAHGIAFSETVLVDDDGASCLTGTERRLFVRT